MSNILEFQLWDIENKVMLTMEDRAGKAYTEAASELYGIVANALNWQETTDNLFPYVMLPFTGK